MCVRILLTAHDARPLSVKNGWLDRARYREADAILVHSSNGVRELIADGVAASKITQIAHPNYLQFCRDHSLPRDEARNLLGIPPVARSILFFGTIAAYKGLDVLLRAFSRVSEEDPHAHLTIAGEPLEDFAPYQALVEQLALTDRVLTDLRHISFAEFAKYFRSADVVVLPYRRIYQSGILQLAYGFGRPVVVTDVGGLGEAVSNDQTGSTVPAEDPRSLALAMRLLLADPGAAEEMGQRGRRLAETKYSWSAIAQEVSDVYHSIRHGACLKDTVTPFPMGQDSGAN
jgi:glycosyltransferase involved in cell wall biosynthesis